MPEIDGFETAKLIREREKSKHTPIIFVSAMFLGDADAFKGYAVGAVESGIPTEPELEDVKLCAPSIQPLDVALGFVADVFVPFSPLRVES